jgi:hypothetical protein
MKNSNVVVVADELGNVIRQSKTNSDYGFIKLEQKRFILGNGRTNFVDAKPVTTILLEKVSVLQTLELQANEVLVGKIIIKESLVPFNKNDADRDLKVAGQTGIVCSVDGQPIYRKTFFIGDVSAQDTLVAHDNGEAISLANKGNTAKVNTTVTPAEAFGIGVDDAEDAVVEMEEESFEL